MNIERFLLIVITIVSTLVIWDLSHQQRITVPPGLCEPNTFFIDAKGQWYSCQTQGDWKIRK